MTFDPPPACAPFQVICEIEPPTKPDLRRVRHQIQVLGPVVSRFLIPDNHLGRPTVSSVAVAHEVQSMGERSIACLNCRDRNLLGLRRDLLTAAAYDVEEFLCVYGDDTSSGRTSQLSVQTMLEQIHGWGTEQSPRRHPRAGVTSRLRSLPAWKHDADFLFVQVCFSATELLRWRETVAFDKPVYPGIMVLANPTMAASLADSLPEVSIPDSLLRQLDKDPDAGVDAACQLVLDLRESGAFEGVHLIPVGRYREVAARLTAELGS